ncbi:MAG: hypothetical protein JO227_03220, partial [Acetobacteraceae bacterium]|nr:hypothetical protein [Acetobacteraceae bacterium]
AIVAAVALTAWAERAEAGGPAPICRADSVLQAVWRIMHSRAAYVEVDPNLVSEEPTAVRNVVRCGICVLLASYDTPVFGPLPVLTCEPHIFTVRSLQIGYVVGFVR